MHIFKYFPIKALFETMSSEWSVHYWVKGIVGLPFSCLFVAALPGQVVPPCEVEFLDRGVIRRETHLGQRHRFPETRGTYIFIKQASTLTQNVTGHVGPVTPWS